MEGWERVGSGSPLVRRAEEGGGGCGRWSKMPEPLYFCCLGGFCILVLFLEFCCYERGSQWGCRKHGTRLKISRFHGARLIFLRYG